VGWKRSRIVRGATLSVRQSASGTDRSCHCDGETGETELGCPQDSRTSAAMLAVGSEVRSEAYRHRNEEVAADDKIPRFQVELPLGKHILKSTKI